MKYKTFSFLMLYSFLGGLSSCKSSLAQLEKIRLRELSLKNNVVYQKGKKLYLTKCALCHELPDKGSLSYNQWKAVLRTMELRMKDKNIPIFSQEERLNILEFFKL